MLRLEFKIIIFVILFLFIGIVLFAFISENPEIYCAFRHQLMKLAA